MHNIDISTYCLTSWIRTWLLRLEMRLLWRLSTAAVLTVGVRVHALVRLYCLLVLSWTVPSVRLLFTLYFLTLLCPLLWTIWSKCKCSVLQLWFSICVGDDHSQCAVQTMVEAVRIIRLCTEVVRQLVFLCCQCTLEVRSIQIQFQVSQSCAMFGSEQRCNYRSGAIYV